MILALLLAAAEPPPNNAIEAERAFAADAQKLGQWTAFRKYAAPDALMFVPQPTNAHAFLKDRKDPPQSVYWWPGRSYVSCDGSFAVNTGPWVRGAGKSVGYFTTVWKRQGDGNWKWIYDAGDESKQLRSEGGDIKPVMASCKGKPPGRGTMVRGSNKPLKAEVGQSVDGTLTWWWIVTPKGERVFVADLWRGENYEVVIHDEVAAPPK